MGDRRLVCAGRSQRSLCPAARDSAACSNLLQAAPTIIEDNCFIGARSEIVEGVVVEEGAVISMGVFIGASTRIYDRERDEVSYGRVPAGAVVVPGSLPSKDGRYGLNCAVIVKRVDAQTPRQGQPQRTAPAVGRIVGPDCWSGCCRTVGRDCWAGCRSGFSPTIRAKSRAKARPTAMVSA